MQPCSTPPLNGASCGANCKARSNWNKMFKKTMVIFLLHFAKLRYHISVFSKNFAASKNPPSPWLMVAGAIHDFSRHEAHEQGLQWPSFSEESLPQ